MVLNQQTIIAFLPAVQKGNKNNKLRKESFVHNVIASAGERVESVTERISYTVLVRRLCAVF